MRINGRFPQSLSARGRNASRFFPRLTNGISGSQCRQHRLRGDGKRLVMYRFPRLTRRPGNGQQFRRQSGKFFARTTRQRDARPEIGIALDSLPDGEDFLMRPVDAGYILYTALKDGSVDLADIDEALEGGQR